MPEYHYRCDDCDFETDLIHSISECDDVHTCGVCPSPMHRVPVPVATIGPMPSKPMTVGGAGVSFDRIEDVRAYEAANPNVRLTSRTSPGWRKHLDEARERAETVAKKQGFRDLDDRRERDRAAKKKGYNSALG